MDNTVVITGASRGLGLELAKKFIAGGDTVYGVSRTRKHWPGAKKAEPSPKFKLLQADLTKEKDAKAVLAKVLTEEL